VEPNPGGQVTATSNLRADSPLFAQWRRWSTLPGGRWLFSATLGLRVPYTGTVHPRVLELRPGFARVGMQDRRRVRNHLDSIHAIALANLGELATGLALLAGLPPDARAILTGISVDFLKKARGALIAECAVDPPSTAERRECVCEAVIRDRAGDDVAHATTRWLVGPRDRR